MGKAWAMGAMMILTMPVATPALAAADALAQTAALVEAFKQVKAPPEGGQLSLDDRKANVLAFNAVDRFFDFEHLTSEPLAQNRASFSKEQLAHFTEQFRELIRVVAYPSAGEFLSTAKYKLRPAKGETKTQEAAIDMLAHVPAEDLDTTVTFHWRQNTDGWRIQDVSFDGASLVKDYRNQFSRIIGKEGVEGLIKRLDKRLQDERKNAPVLP